MPDGTDVPSDLAEAPEHQVPWGIYPESQHGRTRTLLVTSERSVTRFSIEAYQELLRHPLEAGKVRLLRRGGQDWLLAE